MFNRDWRVSLRKELNIFYYSDAKHYTEYTEENFRDEMDEVDFHIQYLRIIWDEIWAEVFYSG